MMHKNCNIVVWGKEEENQHKKSSTGEGMERREKNTPIKLIKGNKSLMLNEAIN